MHTFRPSRYNFVVRGRGGEVALFNASTGCTIRLEGAQAGQLARLLMRMEVRFTGDEFAPDLANRFQTAGFLIEDGVDELEAIRERYWQARGRTPSVLTITTTMDCNLGCYYCYEERSKARLASADIDAIVNLAKRSVAE